MQKVKIFALTMAILSAAAAGCKPKIDQGAPADSMSAMSNADMEKSIHSKFDSDDQLRTANLLVTADTDKREATLSGTVDSDALRQRAIEFAKSAQPGLTVNDKIAVKPQDIARKDFTEDLAKEEWERAKQVGDKVGDTIEDAWLHGKIFAKLIAHSKTPARNINVDVVGGVVTLRGKVSQVEQKSEAERLAKETEGVKKVDNQLEVSA